MKIKDILKESSKRLKPICSRPSFESELMLSYFLKKDRLWLHLNEYNDVDESEFFKLIQRREAHEPIEYITGRVSFYSRDFFVTSGVLIPRPETEILVDFALEYIKDLKNPTICEIGVGSGVISIMLALLKKDLKIIGTDINQKAIDLSIKNSKKYEVDKKISFKLTSMLDSIDERIDILVSNPPYVKDDYPIEKNLEYEPKNALFGGENGDEFLKELIILAKKKNIPTIICEMGYDQKQSIEDFAKELNVKNITFYKDLADLDRGFKIEF